MKKISLFFLLVIGLAACARPKPPQSDPNWFLTATVAPAIRLQSTATLEGELAHIVIGLDMGGGGAGFAATLYAQEVNTGKTFHTFLSAGMHGLAVLPTSEPVSLSVQAPGTYVFYARLINEPDAYHYGYTNCPKLQECTDRALIAIQVDANQTYRVTISDRKAVLPAVDQPVSVPWVLEPLP